MNLFSAGPLLVGCNTALVALAGWFAWCGAGRLVARTRLRQRPVSEQCLFAAVLALSWLLLCILGLGAIGALAGWSAWCSLLLLATVDRSTAIGDPVRKMRRRLRVSLMPRHPAARGLPTLGAWLCVAVVGVALVGGWIWPRADYDALSYHLPYSAAVLDGDGSLPFVDTPFGDSAQAYQPKNDGLLRAVLAPIPRVEALLSFGAWPHLPLLLLAVYVAARAIGARRTHAMLGAAVAALLGPVVMAQAESAMVDLAFASPWFGCVALLCANRRAGHRRCSLAGLGAGLAAGLAFGAKFLAVPYAALLGLMMLWCGPRGLRAWLSFGIGCALTGAYFYVRNASWTGNPLYPVELAMPGGGPELLTGNYGRSEMLEWVYAFRTRPEPLPMRLAMFTHDLFGYAPRMGVTAAVVCPLLAPLVLWLLGTARGITTSGRRSAIGVVTLAPLSLALCWWVVPYNYGRFAIPALAALGVCAAIAPHRSRRASIGIAGLLVVHVLLLTWTGQGEQALIFDHRAWSLGVALVGVVVSRWCPRHHRAAPNLAPGRAQVAVAAGLVGIGAGLTALRQPIPPALLPWPQAATTVARRAGAVAYAGTNLPWPFRHSADGPRPVRYIALDGRPDRFDQRARQWHADGLPAAVCPEPAFYRRRGDPRAWLDAMIAAGVRTLVVAQLTGVQRLNIEHDDDGFPIERTWADRLLSLVEATPTARVYAVPEAAPAVPREFEAEDRTWPDVFWLEARDSVTALFHFPLAAQELAAPVHQRTRERARR